MGWSQTKFKANLNLALTRMRLKKGKKSNASKLARRDIAKLLQNGKEEIARVKVEHVIHEDQSIEAYELIELFCELLVARLSMLNMQKSVPFDLKEAVCTVIYSAPRTDVKELHVVRGMLIDKYGKQFGQDAMENAGNCVNPKVLARLCSAPPENHLVYQYLTDIAKEHGVDWECPWGSPCLPDSDFLQAPPASGVAPLMQPQPWGQPAQQASPQSGQGGAYGYGMQQGGGGGFPVPHAPPHSQQPHSTLMGGHPLGQGLPPQQQQQQYQQHQPQHQQQQQHTNPSNPSMYAPPPAAGNQPPGPPGGRPVFDFPSAGTQPQQPFHFPDAPTGPPRSNRGGGGGGGGGSGGGGGLSLDFPSVPQGGGSSAADGFPSVPGATGMDFPSVPGAGTSSIDLPSPPGAGGGGGGGGGGANFDDLTARFMALKRQ